MAPPPNAWRSRPQLRALSFPLLTAAVAVTSSCRAERMSFALAGCSQPGCCVSAGSALGLPPLVHPRRLHVAAW